MRQISSSCVRVQSFLFLEISEFSIASSEVPFFAVYIPFGTSIHARAHFHKHERKKKQITVVNGEQVWRLSDAVQTSAFGNCPFMQRVQVAGETGAATGGVVSGPAQTKRTCSAFSFKSATGASQPGLYLESNTAPAYNTLRQNYLSIKTGANGFDLTTYTDLLLTDGVTKIKTDDQVIATVSFADWHRVVTTVQFVDGINQGPCPPPYGSLKCYLGNDIVNIFVDGKLAWQGEACFFVSRVFFEDVFSF